MNTKKYYSKLVNLYIKKENLSFFSLVFCHFGGLFQLLFNVNNPVVKSMSSKYTGKVNISKFDKKEKQYSNNANILIGTHLFRIIPKP